MSEEVDRGVEKGALLLLALGEDEAAEVLKHLPPETEDGEDDELISHP